MQGKISKATVEKLKPSEFLADTDCRGFTAASYPAASSPTATATVPPANSAGSAWACTARSIRSKAAKVAAGKVATEGDPSREKQARRDKRRQHIARPVHEGVRERGSGRQPDQARVQAGGPARDRHSIVYTIKRSEIMLMLDEIATRERMSSTSVSVSRIRGTFDRCTG